MLVDVETAGALVAHGVWAGRNRVWDALGELVEMFDRPLGFLNWDARHKSYAGQARICA